MKYQAVLEAKACVGNPMPPPKVRVLLALELALPAELRSVATALGVALLEHVGELPEFAIAKNMRRVVPLGVDHLIGSLSNRDARRCHCTSEEGEKAMQHLKYYYGIFGAIVLRTGSTLAQQDGKDNPHNG